MKTIILASTKNLLENSEIEKYLPKPLSESRVLYVTTASNNSIDKSFMMDTKKIIEGFGARCNEIDIIGKSEKELKDALDECDIVYVEGGNTFFLLKSIRETGFDKLVKEAVERGVTYWGASAGAYIACPSIIVSSWSVARKRYDVTDFTALNFVPFVVKAHYTPEMFETIKEKSKDLQYPLRILNDDQGIVVRDGVKSFIGGEEIVIK